MSEFLDAVSLSICRFLAVYMVHSTIILGGLWVAMHFVNRDAIRLREFSWKVGALLSIATASIPIASSSWMGIDHKNDQSIQSAGTSKDARISDFQARSTHEPHALTEFRSSEPKSPKDHLPQPRSIDGEHLAIAVMGEQSAWNERLWEWDLGNYCTPMAGLFMIYWAMALVSEFRGWIRLRKSMRTEANRNSRAHRLLVYVRQKSGQRVRPRLVVLDNMAQPFVTGVWQPTIAIPQLAVDQLPGELLKALLAHEFGHVIHRHSSCLIAMNMVCRMLPLQPLNFVARRHWRECAEITADDWAMNKCVSGAILAKSLVTIAGLQLSKPAARSIGFATSSDHGLVRRVKRLLRASESQQQKISVWHFHVVAILFAIIACFLQFTSPTIVAAQNTNDRSRVRAEFELWLEAEQELDDLSDDLRTLQGLFARRNFSESATVSLEKLVESESRLNSHRNRIRTSIEKEWRR